MTATTLPTNAPGADPTWRRARRTLVTAAAKGATMASAARQRLRRPALVIGGLGCMDASAWHTFGLGAGLLALGLSLWTFEWLTGDDEPGSTP